MRLMYFYVFKVIKFSRLQQILYFSRYLLPTMTKTLSNALDASSMSVAVCLNPDLSINDSEFYIYIITAMARLFKLSEFMVIIAHR